MKKPLFEDQGELDNLLKEMSITDRNDPPVSAWFPGGVSKFFSSIQKSCAMENHDNIEVGNVYVLLNGTGSIYNEQGDSVGYFQGFGSSFLRVDELNPKPMVTVFGTQFKVTSDGGIGNTPSKWAEWESDSFGEALLDNIRLAEVSTVLEELKKWNERYSKTA